MMEMQSYFLHATKTSVRLEAIASRLEAIVLRLEAIARN